jgi:hypothetical protein
MGISVVGKILRSVRSFVPSFLRSLGGWERAETVLRGSVEIWPTRTPASQQTNEGHGGIIHSLFAKANGMMKSYDVNTRV